MTTNTIDENRFDPWWFRKVCWWPMAVPVLFIAAGVVISRYWPAWFQTLQNRLEAPAPYIVLAVAAIYLVRAVVTFNPLYLILAALAGVLACREFHFAGTDRGVFVGLGLVGVWIVLWRKKLWAPLRDWRHLSWLVAMLFAYALSQMVAKRWFKFIPGEHDIHRSLEEVAETGAHVVFLIASLVGNWRRFGRRAKPADPNEAASAD